MKKMGKLKDDLHIAMNKVWRGSHGDGSTFSLTHSKKEVVSNVKSLAEMGYVGEDYFEIPGRDPGINGKITDKGREYCREYFGDPPVEL